MYCPRCGHQPIADSLRFCSYCGFKLGVVKASLADEEEASADSFTIQVIPWEEPPANSFSLNQRGMLFGSILMFTSTIVLAMSSLLIFGRMRTPQLLLALVGAFVVLLLISKELMRAARYLVAGDVVLPQSAVTHDPAALTAGQNVPVSLFTAQRVTTAEITSPASVIEQTTNLLENK
jgi:hypothetical protein